MSNIANTTNFYVGSAKETFGKAVGSDNMASSGAAQRAAADTASQQHKAHANQAGMANKMSGAVRENLGSVTGNQIMANQGKATRNVGQTQDRF